MPDESSRMIGRFLVRETHFERVRECMKVGLLIEVTDAVVVDFLTRHPTLLGMIVGYDEVETEAERDIWEGCRSDFPPVQQRFYEEEKREREERRQRTEAAAASKAKVGRVRQFFNGLFGFGN